MRPAGMRPSSAAAITLFLLSGATAFAAPASVPASPAAPCAVITEFSGQVEIMDSTRTRLIDAASHVGVPCDGWISVKAGWVKLRHRNGQVLHVAPESFVSVPDSDTDPSIAQDHFVLLKGEVYGDSSDGGGELRISTVNGRAKLKGSSGVLVYSQQEDESQLIVLQGNGTFENRFEGTAAMKLHAGEASTINSRVLRLAPSAPKSVSLASLRPKLQDLQLSEVQAGRALVAARDRGDRKFASFLVPKDDDGPVTRSKTRTPASLLLSRPPTDGAYVDKAPSAETIQKYARHPADRDDPQLRTHLMRKMVAGHDVGEKILFPDKYYGRQQKMKLVVVQPLEKMDGLRSKEETLERAKLIEELSQVRAE